MQETPQHRQPDLAKNAVSRNTRAVWLFLALIALGDACGLHAEGMRVPPRELLFSIETTVLFLLLSVIFTRFVKRPVLAEAAHMTAVIFAFMPLAGIASYLAAAAPYPLVDDRLVLADHALGLDWLASYQWIKSHPHIEGLLAGAYASFAPQFVLLFLLLNWRGKCARAWEMIWLCMISCMACILVSVPWPAAGAFHYYHIKTPEKYVRTFVALHKGLLKVIGNKPLQGVIQFPSFHTALAVVLAYAARGLGVLSLCYIALDVLVVLSAPYMGGHYYTDILGGLVVALATILAVRQAKHRMN